MAEKELKEKEGKGLEPTTARRRPLSVFDEMERMFERMTGRGRFPEMPRLRWLGDEPGPYPTVDIFEQDDMVVIRAEIPGVAKDDLTIDVADDAITISGEKKETEEVEEKDYYRRESVYGSFTRSFTLPSGVDADKADASFREGILEVKLPVKEQARKRKIEIK